MYNVICIYGAIYLFYVATKWKQIMFEWFLLERTFLAPPFVRKKCRLQLKINLIAFFLVAMQIGKKN